MAVASREADSAPANRIARRLGVGLRAADPWTLAVGALLLAATAAPFWAGRWLPFLDLPQHVGLSAVIHHYADPAWDFRRFYALDLRPLPYWGFYLPVHLLGYLMPLEAAARVVLAASAVALPLGLRQVLGAFGRDRRLALFAVPLAFNKNLFMGFTSFYVSLPLWLFALAAAERWLADPTGPGRRGRAVRAAALAVAVYFAHGQSFLLLVCAVGLLWLAHGPRWRSLPPFAPAAGLMAYWMAAVVLAPAEEVAAGEHLTVLGGLGVPGRVSWNAPADNLGRMGDYLFDAYAGSGEDALFLGLAGLLLVLVVLRSAGAPASPGRNALHRWRLEWTALGLLAAYFVAPMEIGLQWYVNPRHLVFAALLAPAFAGAVPFARWRRWLLVPTVLLALAVPLHAAGRIARFQAEVGDFQAVLDGASRGGRTLGLVFDNGAGRPVKSWPFLHFAGWLQAARGGDLGFSFAGLPSIPVRYRPGAQAPHPYEWRPSTFTWREHGLHYDRILVRGTPRGEARRLQARARRVVQAGGWTLYELDGPAGD